MPKPAAASTARAASAPPVKPNLCCFAAATTAELLPCLGGSAPLPGPALPRLSGEGVHSHWRAELELAAASVPLGPGRAARLRLSLEAFQIGAHVGSVLVTQVAILLQRLVDDAFQFGGQVGIHAHGSDRRAIQNLALDYSRAFAPERQCAGRHFIEHGAE